MPRVLPCILGFAVMAHVGLSIPESGAQNRADCLQLFPQSYCDIHHPTMGSVKAFDAPQHCEGTSHQQISDCQSMKAAVRSASMSLVRSPGLQKIQNDESWAGHVSVAAKAWQAIHDLQVEAARAMST